MPIAATNSTSSSNVSTEHSTQANNRLTSAGDDNKARQKRPGLFRKLLGEKLILINVLFLLFVGVCAIAPDVIAPQDPDAQSLRGRLEAPMATTDRGRHWLGTDSLGRDVFSRIVHGARISVVAATASVVIAGAVGIALGLVSGYFGGWIDDFIGWITNVQLSFPVLLLAVAVISVLGPGLRNVILVLGATTWVVYGRVVRGETLILRDAEYVEASRVLGAGTPRILLRHILPNIATPLVIISTFQIAQIIIAEASLSFLGLGAGAQYFSWGTLMADGRTDLATSWWVATMPGIAIMLTVLAINLCGDWLRDELDPRATKA